MNKKQISLIKRAIGCNITNPEEAMMKVLLLDNNVYRRENKKLKEEIEQLKKQMKEA